MRQSLSSAAILTLPLLLGSCQKVPDLGALGAELKKFLPTIAYDSLDVKSIDFKRIQADVVLSVDNPNPVELGLNTLDYALKVGGSDLLTGSTTAGLTMGASSKSELRVPISVVYADIGDVLSATKGKDEIGWSLSGEMGVKTPIGVAPLPVNVSGTMPALRTPSIKFDKIRVEELKILENKASLAVDLAVTNDQASALSLADVQYGLKLQSNEVANGRVDSLGSAAAGTSTVTLPVDLSLTGLGQTLLDVLTNKGDIKADLSASMTVQTPFGPVPLSIDEGGQVKVL